MKIPYYKDVLIIFGIFLIIGLPSLGVILQSPSIVIASENSNQAQNFTDDLNKASNYWTHNKLASSYFRNGNYEEAVEEYKKAIEDIENMPGDKWPNLKNEDVDRMNQQSRIDAQIFSRYGLAEALEKVGRYEEAIRNVEWLQQNQRVKGKEDLLKQKLEAMKQNLLQKMQQS